jgi:hypothetical protein
MNFRRATEVLKLLFGRRVSMFERFTSDARRAIFVAQGEADEAGSSSIETEHILLALLGDRWLSNALLQGISAAGLRNEIHGGLANAQRREKRDLPLSDESKRILAYAAEEAEALLDSHIGDEHLLLGLLRERSCKAAVILVRSGLTLENLRARIRQIPSDSRKVNHAEGPKRWRSAGIPEGYAWPRLFYNKPSEIVIVELKGAGEEFRPARLFIRRKSAETYEQIGSPAESDSYESAVTAEQTSVVAFNSFTYTNGGGGNWAGVYTFDLTTFELSVCVSKDNFVSPAPYSGGWIAELLSISGDGRNIYVKAALRSNHEHGKMIDYYLARLELKSGQLELISLLRDAFF